MQKDLKQLVAQMTLEEKAGLCSGFDFWNLKGVERLSIPSIMVTDGPHGLRKQDTSADHLGLMNSVPATCFPTAAGLASSWNRELIHQVGVALGEECQAENVAVLLGPGVNIKRSPLNGRNFEYFSEDPFLASEMAAHHILGVQSQGVGTSLKHFAVNNQEHRRMSVDAVVDERTLREIYLAAFEGAVKQAQPWTVMSSYNRVNGTYASENERLLTEILRDEWGFEGFVVSDWGAVNEQVSSLLAGMDLEMPSSNGIGEQKIVAAVREGQLSEAKLDETVLRILRIIQQSVDNRRPDATYDKEAHHQLARQTAQESMVLLKNEGGVLPLSKEAKVAVIGGFAVKARFQGSGSSHIVPTRLDQAYEEMTKRSSSQLVYAQGYPLEHDNVDEALLAEAVEAARHAETAVLFVGLPDRYESEGFDRQHLRLPDSHRTLIEEIAKVQPRIVVVLSNGAPVEMPWLDKAQAVLEGYLGGQAFGSAVADLLYGDANPSGKLAETFPLALAHNPSHLNFPGEGDKVEYKEGIFVGYRYYEAKQLPVLFPFGFGLSYTSFEYTGLTISQSRIQDTETVDVEVNVKNTGSRAGKEIVQLYVTDVESHVIRPRKELKEFTKVELEPGEEKSIVFTLGKRAFAYYNTALSDWHVESGEFVIAVGGSSDRIALEASLHVESTVELSSSYTRNSILGDLLSKPQIAELAQPLLAKFQQEGAFSGVEEDDSHKAMMEAVFKYMPLRSLISFSGGCITETDIEELLERLNSI